MKAKPLLKIARGPEVGPRRRKDSATAPRLLRYSGTEPVRLLIEGEDQPIEAHANRIAEKLQEPLSLLT